MDENIVIKIGADIKELSDKLAESQKALNQMGKMGEEAGTRGAIGIGKILTALGLVAAATKVFGMIKDSIGSAFSRIDTMEQFERVMTVMTGSSEKANSVLETINDTVKGTAYGLDVAAKATQDFVTSNMDVDKATESVAAWGDAVAFYGDGSNATFASVSDALAKATAKGKVQMDTMNRLAEAGIPAMQIYADATGQSVEQVADSMQKGELRADKFMNVMNDAMANGTKNFDAIGGAAKEAGSSWGASFDNMRAAVTRGVVNIIKKIDEMLTSNGLPDMREMVAEFGRKFEEALNKVVELIPKVVDVLKNLFDSVRNVYEAIKPWIPLMTAVAAGILTAVTAFKAFEAVKTIIAGAKASVFVLKNAFLALNTTMLANPIFWLIAAIVAAAILVYVYWEPISQFFKALWEGVKKAGIVLWDELKGVWTSTVEFFTNLWSTVSDFFTDLWSSIVEIATSVWDAVTERWNQVVEFAKNIFGPMLEFYAELWTTIVETASEIWNMLTETLSTVWESISTAASAAWELIKNVILGPILLLINLVTGDMEGFRENLKAIWDNIKSAASTIWESLKTAVVTVIKGAVTIGMRLWNNFKDAVTGLWQALKDTATNIWEALKTSIVTLASNIATEAVNKFEDLKRDAINKVKDLVKDLLSKWDDLKTDTLDKIKKVKDNVLNPLKEIDLLQIGKDVIQGFINGIKSKVEDVASAAKDAADAVTGKIKSILGIKSPARVLMALGRNTGEGLAIGIASMRGDVEKSAQQLADAAVVEPSLGFNADGRMHSSMASALNGSVDVNQRDSAIVGAIASLERKLTDLRVEMNGITVGNIVTDTVSENINRETTQTARGRGRRRI